MADPHEPFSNVTLKTPDGAEHDVTRLFQESPEERAAREAFYRPGGERVGDIRFNTIGTSGKVSIEQPVENFSRVMVTLADEDGQVISQCMGEVTVGFAKSEKDGVIFIERKHKVKLVDG